MEVREDPADPQCLAVPEGLDLAVMCLVQNALEALAVSQHPDAPITVSIEAEEDRASVVVRDEGCGMTPEVLQNAMTPFYTTKQGDNQGGGPGLAPGRGGGSGSRRQRRDFFHTWMGLHRNTDGAPAPRHGGASGTGRVKPAWRRVPINPDAYRFFSPADIASAALRFL